MRISHEITQLELAKKLGVSKSYLSKFASTKNCYSDTRLL
ncbi:helix-turn-helix domain-containing protein [uncultured Nostoc sp.]